MSIERLMALQPPADVVVENEQNWEMAALSIPGVVEFPEDYKSLIARYGSTCFGEFIWVLSPFSENPNIRLDNQLQNRRDALKALANDFGERVPHEIDKLVPWFITDNGDVGYWFVEGNSNNWMILVNESRGERWFQSDKSTVDFLCDLLTGAVTLPFFPSDFPSGKREADVDN